MVNFHLSTNNAFLSSAGTPKPSRIRLASRFATTLICLLVVQRELGVGYAIARPVLRVCLPIPRDGTSMSSASFQVAQMTRCSVGYQTTNCKTPQGNEPGYELYSPHACGRAHGIHCAPNQNDMAATAVACLTHGADNTVPWTTGNTGTRHTHPTTGNDNKTVIRRPVHTSSRMYQAMFICAEYHRHKWRSGITLPAPQHQVTGSIPPVELTFPRDVRNPFVFSAGKSWRGPS